MILNIDSLSKKYRQGDVDVDALQGVSFNMEKGETLAIVGPSGSGKTTLLSLLAGLDEPTSGKIQLVGQELTQLSEQELTEFRSINMGIIFQQFHLLPYLTALENVCLPLEINGESQVEERARLAMKKVGLSEREHHRPEQMSGGERQRVAIARALVIEPKVLLADEPSGNLDTQTGESVMDLLFELVKENEMTLILVTHNLEHAKRCQRVVELKSGFMQ